MENARFIEVSAEVRFWEDASLNGEVDTEGNIPLRKGDLWKPIIDLDTGRVQNWPAGVTADVYYKVCDQGKYWLLNDGEQRIAKWKDDYVPKDILCVGEIGYGKYIIMKVAGNGRVVGWRKPLIDAKQWVSV